MEIDERFLLLDLRDNVAVARCRIRAGDTITVGSQALTLSADLPIGHKVAVRLIGQSDKIVKYGAPIGVALQAIAIGEHVHTRNVRSDYTPSYTLDAARMTAEGT